MTNTREQKSEQNGRFTTKETKIENEMKKKGKNEESEKKTEVRQKQSTKKKRRYFSNVEEMKSR